ncbi:MAG TPA: SpoIIE family protein phosphatase, partial [Bacteroidales bacterium]|nr:SpoIIE family protein phosphatase [Bacteroidales bacterium]
TEKEGLSNNIVWSILQDHSGNLWFGTYGGGLTVLCSAEFAPAVRPAPAGCKNVAEAKLQNTSGTINTPANKFFDGRLLITLTEKEGLVSNYIFAMLEDKSGNLWFGTRFGLSKLPALQREKLVEKILICKKNGTKLPENEVFFKNYDYYDGFLGIGVNGGNNGKNVYEAGDGTIWIAANDRLTAYHPEGDPPDTIPPNVQLTGIELFSENIEWVNLEKNKDTSFVLGNGVKVGNFEFDGITKWYWLPENLSLAYNNNYLTFNFIGITQKFPKKVKYQYKLEGIDENWSAITGKTYASYGNLPHGKYTFKVKAMNSEGYWSKEFTYSFEIRPPWWLTWWFRTIYITAAILALFGLYRWRTASLRKRQKELVIKIKEATVEIRKQNEEITKQRDEIEAQRDLVINQKEHIEALHKDLIDSINYAERIQRSFLATKELLDENLKEYFIFFHPKDVVSGDFYWATKLINGNFVLATADSTGHGVPGAIMSILNISSIEKAIEQGLNEPSEILNLTRKIIIERLKKDGSPEGGKDGMDVSLICFDFVNNKFSYSAANNPIWVIRQNLLIELKPDKMPVGKNAKDQIPFTQNEFQLQKGDVVYTLTDGLPDQFGGPQGKKFLSKNLKQLLTEICYKPMSEQKEILDYTLENWKNYNGIKYEQTDDITIVGIRI